MSTMDSRIPPHHTRSPETPSIGVGCREGEKTFTASNPGNTLDKWDLCDRRSSIVDIKCHRQSALCRARPAGMLEVSGIGAFGADADGQATTFGFAVDS
ncbi:hypothetical protein [Kibdelosporangium philippinense]|uniref:hypothetical protein n=1 Tax=Kibdelosporangium philippinense TaxID=211113 RepID=UPI00361CD6E8